MREGLLYLHNMQNVSAVCLGGLTRGYPLRGAADIFYTLRVTRRPGKLNGEKRATRDKPLSVTPVMYPLVFASNTGSFKKKLPTMLSNVMKPREVKMQRLPG